MGAAAQLGLTGLFLGLLILHNLALGTLVVLAVRPFTVLRIALPEEQKVNHTLNPPPLKMTASRQAFVGVWRAVAVRAARDLHKLRKRVTHGYETVKHQASPYASASGVACAFAPSSTFS